MFGAIHRSWQNQRSGSAQKRRPQKHLACLADTQEAGAIGFRELSIQKNGRPYEKKEWANQESPNLEMTTEKK